MSEYPYQSKYFNFVGDGLEFTTSPGIVTNGDFKLPENLFITGGAIRGNSNIHEDDYIEIQIIDIDNILGMGINTVLKQYIKKWYLPINNVFLELKNKYGGEILKDLYIRVRYHSFGLAAVKIKVNFDFHREI